MRKFIIKKMAIFLTEKCDKSCHYCDIPTLKNPKGPDLDLINKYLPIIDKDESFVHYTITGGEPGLASEDVWESIFSLIECHPIRINTNGKFFENGYYDKYKEKIWEVGIHVDVGEEINILSTDEGIWYYLPVNKQNFKDVPDYISKYPTLNFSLIPYLHKSLQKNYDEYALSYNDYKELNKSIASFNNIAACGKEMLDLVERSNNLGSLDLFRESCKYTYVQPILDFVNGRIGRCVFSYTQNIYREMNRENLLDLFNYKLDFGSVDTSCDVCDECFRYFDYYMNNLIFKSQNK
jgi:organic radical activating enzyme